MDNVNRILLYIYNRVYELRERRIEKINYRIDLKYFPKVVEEEGIESAYF